MIAVDSKTRLAAGVRQPGVPQIPDHVRDYLQQAEHLPPELEAEADAAIEAAKACLAHLRCVNRAKPDRDDD